MSDLGSIFPPRDEWDIAAYPIEDVVEGYRDHKISDPEPGGNHAPGYRWGWLNARKDATRAYDGFDEMRSAFIRMSRKPH